MRITSEKISFANKLIRLAGIALSMAMTFGLAVGVSGSTAQSSVQTNPAPSTPPSFLTVRFAKQSALRSEAPAGVGRLVEAIALPARNARGARGNQPELLHDSAADVIAKPALPVRRMVKMQVTAYCPCPKCCGPDAAGITASGKLVTYNAGRFVAADASLPFGTKLIIPGYESTPVEVLDRGGAIRGNRIDVFFATHQQALTWGRRNLQVTILE